MYRYQGCDLPNVFLSNGYEITKSPYGKGVIIHDLDGLHAALGNAVASNPAPLRGYEFRFLRNELELSQAALGELLGCDEQTIARWEKGKGKKVNAPAERLLRRVYLESKAKKGRLAPLVEQLKQLECIPPSEPMHFVARERGNMWQAIAQVAQ